MKELSYTLLSDGPFDAALIPILTWLLRTRGVDRPINASWADLRGLRKRRPKLDGQIRDAVQYFPCELLFVHRDAEGQAPEQRHQEIRAAASAVADPGPIVVGVVPVRMTEAWLLIDEKAIRHAAENPNGQAPLKLPRLSKLESEPRPKDRLLQLLKEASSPGARHRRKFKPEQAATRVSRLIDDFSPLRKLSAFARLESEVAKVVQDHQWDVD